MGTLSFSEIASAILASVSTGGSLHTKAVTGTESASGDREKFYLKGKLDLSLWKNIGNDDDDEEEEDDEEDEEMELTGKGSHLKPGGIPTTPPPPSPILASLLGTKSKKESGESGGSIKRTFSPIPILTLRTNSNSLGVPTPAVVIVPTEGSSYSHHYNNSLVGVGGGTPLLSSSSPILPSSSSLQIQSHYGNQAIELGGVTPTPATLFWSGGGADDDGGSARHHVRAESQQSGGGVGELSLLRQQSQLLTTGSSITSQLGKKAKPQKQVGKGEEKEQEHQQQEKLFPPLLPSVLSSFIGSSQLSKVSQFPSGRERVRSAKKVGFGEQMSMEQEATTREQNAQPSLSTEKGKRTESAKDGTSAANRSRSNSAIRRPSTRAPTDILQEIRKMSLASQDALEEKKKTAEAAGSAPTSGRKFGKKGKFKRRKPEEVFTDKDRAAAVTLGSKDIKQSLKAKKKRDRKMRLSISFLSGEDYVVGALMGEAAYQMRVKNQPEAALHTLNKALEIQPNHRGALVARSQCYLKLGDAESALKDAELTWDPNNQNDRYIQGLYQYAEALYQLGEFEKALIAFHRGHRIRKDQDGFRIGIQKCQEAICRAIGSKTATNIPNLEVVLPLIQEFDEVKSRMTPEETKDKNDDQVLKNIVKYKDNFHLSSPQDTKVKSRLITRELMGQLYLDKSYLKKFVNRPEVINQQGLAKGLRDEACEALKYLESRESFWRQQNPLYSRKNFTTMLKAHAHDVACREQAVIEQPSVAKYLQRRGSALITSSSPPPPLLNQQKPSGPSLLKRRSSSEVQLNQRQRMKSVERESVERCDNGKSDEKQINKSLKKTTSIESVRSKSNNRVV